MYVNRTVAVVGRSVCSELVGFVRALANVCFSCRDDTLDVCVCLRVHRCALCSDNNRVWTGIVVFLCLGIERGQCIF